MTAVTEREDEAYFLEPATIPGDAESEAGIVYEEVHIDDDEALIQYEGEEDLNIAVQILKEASADKDLQKGRLSPVPIPEATLTYRPEVVDDFVRNFLVKNNMWRTLDCFQHEWYELKQIGKLSSADQGTVPDVYTKNNQLDNENKYLQEELEMFKTAAGKAKENFVKMRKERDFHRMHHRRVVQEKNTLIDNLTKLRKHYESYEPALQHLKKKYEVAMREKMLSKLERDRALGQVSGLQATLKSVNNIRSDTQAQFDFADGGKITGKLIKSPDAVARVDSTLGSTQQRLYEARKMDSANEKLKTLDPSDVVNIKMPRHGDDTAWPKDCGMNPELSKVVPQCAHLTRVGGFRLTHTFQAHDLAVSSIALHPKQDMLVTASDDRRWKMWQVPTGEIMMTGEGHTDWVSGCDFSYDGDYLATSSGDSTVKIWSFEEGKCIHTFAEHQFAVWAVSYHHTGKFVASCSVDNTAKIWDLGSLRCRQTLRGHTDSVNSVQFLKYSNTLCSSSADKTVSLWDARTGLCAQTFYGHIHSVNDAAFNIRGDTIASCDSYGIVKLWDVRTVSPYKTIDVGPYPCNAAAFDPGCSVLALGSSDGSVKMIEIASDKVLSLSGHQDTVQSTLFSRQGDYLISGSSDCTVRIWS